MNEYTLSAQEALQQTQSTPDGFPAPKPKSGWNSTAPTG